jgi:nucleotide-binding universal stress UspA family protein
MTSPGEAAGAKPIVVGVDGSDDSRAALEWACEEARLRRAGLVVLHAWKLLADSRHPSGSAVPEADLQALKEQSVRLFDEAVAAVGATGAGVERRVVDELPASALIDASRDAGLLVVGSRGRGGFAGLLLGSVGYACAQGSSCPVAIIRRPPPRARGRAAVRRLLRPEESGDVVVGVDGSAASRKALAWAADEARLRGARLRAVHAVELPAASWLPGLAAFSAGLAEQGVAVLNDAIEQELGAAVVEREAPHDSPARALLRAARDADLLVVGSRGRGGFAGRLGSVSHQCAQHSPCPLVIVH